MPRIAPIEPEAATGKAKELLAVVQTNLGVTPNLMKTLAVAPAALQGYLDLNAALARGVLDVRFREEVALTVAQANACEYCLSVHTKFASMAGLPDDEIARSRGARSSDRRRNAGLQFARAVVSDRGAVSDATLAAARSAGLTDAEIVEIVAHVAINVFTNYINHVADTTLDFPRVDVEAPAGV